MKKVLSILASILFVATVNAGEFPDISIDELKSAIKAKKVTVIDVNGAKSYSTKGHIPGAVEYGAVKADLASVLPKDKKALVVAYCGNPSCQAYAAAAKAAQKLGYTNVKHLSAGISGWLTAGEAVEKPEKAN